ncbi:MAG: segregation/condensation protein A [Firmicutes bacterium]|nr:segregation/condensation protein A [Bacillota bacterium]
MTETISYKLGAFEGPLDLLLHLIAKNKLNIYDIQISLLLDQYMEQIDRMREENLEIASEFLEMAARLVYIKTVSLLPKSEESEELKKELTGQLLEYQECRRIAALLAEHVSFDSFVREPGKLDVDQTYTREHLVKELTEAYYAAVGRGGRKLPPPAEAFSGIVEHKIVSVSSRVFHVLRTLRRGACSLNGLIESSRSRSELIATFLAVLELIRAERIFLEDNGSVTLNTERSAEHGDYAGTSSD